MLLLFSYSYSILFFYLIEIHYIYISSLIVFELSIKILYRIIDIDGSRGVGK